MADEGLIDSAPGRAFHKSGGVPKVTVLRVVEVDDSGKVCARARAMARRNAAAASCACIERGRRGALGIGDRVLARTEERGQGYVAHPMKKLAAARPSWCWAWSRKEGERFWLTPVDKKERRELAISDLKDAEPGDLVLCEVSGRPPRVTRAGRRGARRPVRAAQLQPDRDPQARPAPRIPRRRRSTRRIASSKQPLGEREDLTHLPIVAIDPADARDHDDAIWAQPDDDGRAAAGTRSSPSPTSASTSAPAPSSTARRGRAATASISPTASCRCCPRNCRPTSAR